MLITACPYCKEIFQKDLGDEFVGLRIYCSINSEGFWTSILPIPPSIASYCSEQVACCGHRRPFSRPSHRLLWLNLFLDGHEIMTQTLKRTQMDELTNHIAAKVRGQKGRDRPHIIGRTEPF